MKMSHLVLVLWMTSLLACGSTVPEASEIKTVRILNKDSQKFIYGDEQFVYLKRCLDSTEQLGKDCEPAENVLFMATPAYLSVLQQEIAGDKFKPYIGIKAEDKIKQEIAVVEASLRELNEPAQSDNLKARLTALKQLSWQATQARDLLNLIISADEVSMVPKGHIRIETLEKPFKVVLGWSDEQSQMVWQDIRARMNWFDATSTTRERDQWYQPSQHYQAGCAERLGSDWRLPTLEELKIALSHGLKLSDMFRVHSPEKIWTSHILAQPNGFTYVTAYNLRLRWAEEIHRWNERDVFCIRTTTNHK